jgi:hypothetical protein
MALAPRRIRIATLTRPLETFVAENESIFSHPLIFVFKAFQFAFDLIEA